MTSQVPTGWKPEYPFEQIKLTLREEWKESVEGKHLRDSMLIVFSRSTDAAEALKLADVGINQIADWWFKTLTEKIEGMRKPVRHFSANDDERSNEVDATGAHKCNFNCRPDTDEVGFNTALDSVLNLLK